MKCRLRVRHGSAKPYEIMKTTSGILTGLLLTHVLAVCGAAAAQTPQQPSVPIDQQNRPRTSYPGGKWEPGPARFGVVIVNNVDVTMNDGAVLNATVAYPTDMNTGQRAAGRFPVVVEHMPYEQFAAPVTVNTYFAGHGYISVLVRARGLGKSTGEVQFLSPREGQDGRDIVNWAAHKLEGSDGRVGLIGCSWPGAIALTDAAHVGAGSPLKAVVAACSGLENMPRQSWLIGGMPTMSFWQFDVRGPQLVGGSPASVRFFRGMTRSVLDGGDVAYDREYWRERGRASLAQKIVDNGVPVLLWAGWGDVVETGTVRAYTALQNAYAKRPVDAPMDKDQATTPRYQLIMGGWEHGEGLDLGLYLQWLETWLKGVDTGIQHAKTPMHVFEKGTERWLNMTGFPQVAKSTPWWFGSKGALNTKASSAGSVTLNYAQPDDEGGKLSFTTPPLTEGATLAGPISATIYARSNNTNMVLIGRLFDVAPDGTATLLSRGAMVGSLRSLDQAKSWYDKNGLVIWPWPMLKRDEYLTPNKTYRFDLSLAPRQWGVKPGHRVRFEITTQTPSVLCPATGAPPKNDTEPCRLTGPQQRTVPGGVYRVLFGPKTPSALNLPQLPFKAFAEVRAGKLSVPWNEGFRRIESIGSGSAAPSLPLDWGTEP
jgi:predicted acyl esterase